MKLTNLASFTQKMEDQLYDLLSSKVNVLKAKSNQLIATAYSGTFSKNPIDTGNAKANTRVIITGQKRPSPQFSIVFEIDDSVDYAIYFLEPLQARNPNYKYGKRNVVKSARDQLAQSLGIK